MRHGPGIAVRVGHHRMMNCFLDTYIHNKIDPLLHPSSHINCVWKNISHIYIYICTPISSKCT